MSAQWGRRKDGRSYPKAGPTRTKKHNRTIGALLGLVGQYVLVDTGGDDSGMSKVSAVSKTGSKVLFTHVGGGSIWFPTEDVERVSQRRGKTPRVYVKADWPGA